MNATNPARAIARLGTHTRFVTAMLSIAALAAVFASTAAARPAHAHGRHAAVKPSIVLVHGAWADSGSWDRVTRRLQDHGFTVYAPPNPLMGLTTDAGTIANFLSSITGPIV